MAEPVVRRATAGDEAAILALLRAADLPVEGVAGNTAGFVLAEADARVVGVAGLERYGDAALLRSVAVDASQRGRGVAALLTRRVLEAAALDGARAVYLLTTTAEGYFPRHGFRPTTRDAVPAAVRASVEFTSACPATAAVMVLDLEQGEAGDG